MIKKFAAEFIGTFTLVLFGCGSAVLAGDIVGQDGIAWAFGLSIVAMGGVASSIGCRKDAPAASSSVDAVDASEDDGEARSDVDGAPRSLGDQVDMVPGQVRTTFNLHDHVWVTRGDEIVGCWPISARGSSQ